MTILVIYNLLIVLILPLCFTKKIDFLKYAAAMGVFVILYVVFLIIYEYFRQRKQYTSRA